MLTTYRKVLGFGLSCDEIACAHVRASANLQFAVLSILASESMSGRAVRERLAELELEKAGPAFYRLMSRLEEGSLVSGWYEQEVLDGQLVRERYKATSAGLSASESAPR